MPKKAVSVTLENTNLLWLRSRTVALKGRSVSETLDDLVTAARTGGAAPIVARSIAGTADIADDDAGLDRADAYLREVFSTSLAQPFLVRESPQPAPRKRLQGRRRG